MVELALCLGVELATEMGYLLWEVGARVWRFLLWATEPIRAKLAHQRMIKEEREKELRLLEALQQAVREIDAAVAECDRMHAEALAGGRPPASPRRSGSRSGGI